jgi:hypothetical protein
MEIDAERSPPAGVEQLVIGAVEGVLHGPAEVPKVGRAAQQVAVGIQHLDRRYREGGSPDDLHALDVGVGRPSHHRLEHLLTVRTWGVVDD